MSHAGKTESPVANTAAPHPGYAPDAAFHAIKRHALEFVNPKELQVKILLMFIWKKKKKTYTEWVFPEIY